MLGVMLEFVLTIGIVIDKAYDPSSGIATGPRISPVVVELRPGRTGGVDVG